MITTRASAGAATVTPPDTQIKVPTNLISIGTNAANGHRQLQFTHITWDAGTGPFEIDPTYTSATGMASFVQSIYSSSSPGVWQFDHSVQLAVTGAFDAPSDYRFPLTSFTLNGVNADGSIGAAVATSPKTDYCITADAFVGGVPNTPNQTFIPANNCTDPTKPLGWSVGWGDQYDQTDNGQPIDLTGVQDGTYILRATVDPEHVLIESNTANDAVDTKVQITGSTVTVLSQTSPVVSPPQVTLTSPANGSSVSGTVMLQASPSATAPAIVASVQFLLDGQPLGPPVTSLPYSYAWTVGSTPLGTHKLSARVNDSAGNMGTAPVETVTVAASGSGTPVLDRSVTNTGAGVVTTSPFSRAAPNETLLALVGSDGPSGSGNQSVTVSGAGLSWSPVKRSNGQFGDSEIWVADATSQLSNVTVTSTQLNAGYSQQVTVLTFENSGGVGASAVASSPSGAPTLSMTSTVGGSLSYAVGNDYDNAIARTVGPGQALVSQWLNTVAGDTYWVQGTSLASTTTGQQITLNDTAPIADEWNLTAVEVTPATSPPPDTTPPTVTITNPASGQAVSGTISVAADAFDDVAVARVAFFLDGQLLGKAVTTTPYSVQWDTTKAPNAPHTLTAWVVDTAGNIAASFGVPVTVQNPAPPMTCFVMQADVSVHGHGTVTTASFHTAIANETLLAFVGSDGPDGGAQSVTVAGAGLTWTPSQASEQPSR